MAATADSGQRSPITTLLSSMGMTRDDLSRRSDQMRQFLTADTDNSLAQHCSSETPSYPPSAHALSRGNSISTSMTSASLRTSSPSTPATPIKSEPLDEPPYSRPLTSMEAVLERKSHQSKKEKKGRKEKDKISRSSVPSSSPTQRFSPFGQTRGVGRVDALEAYTRAREGPFARNGPRDDSSTRTVEINSTQSVLYPRLQHGPSTSQQPTTPIPKGEQFCFSLPPSSPPPSSPASSPVRPVVNIVSSPGAVDELEDEYDELPYTLPPGPYSPMKPDYPYAALIGQAIISSHEHRLTLQEIYDFITTVYPYFRRGETTWMNSIRHVLSTTKVFRKVQRERAVGRTLWAVWDQDLPCFAGGGFNRHLCQDMAEQPRQKPGPKKRNASGVVNEASTSRAAKRPKKTQSKTAVAILPVADPHRSFSLYPPIGPHIQPYYQDYSSATQTDLLFPSLPSSDFVYQASSSPISSSRPSSDPAPFTSSSSSSTSLPELTPNGSSSSPACPDDDEDLPQELTTDAEVVTASSPLVPYPSQGPFSSQGSFRLSDTLDPSQTILKSVDKGKGKQVDVMPKMLPAFPSSMPSSPTLGRRVASHIATQLPPCTQPALPLVPARLSTPVRPCTPPRNSSNSPLVLSPTRTPLSHKGLHMSPSRSLLHYKSSLHPPPPVTFDLRTITSDGSSDKEGFLDSYDRPATPSPSRRHIDLATYSLPPVTPKRLAFPFVGSSSTESPLRTPGRRSIFDPYDPSAMLDEEFSRLHSQGQDIQDSPGGGFFGRSRGLLYESPNLSSPGQWRHPTW